MKLLNTLFVFLILSLTIVSCDAPKTADENGPKDHNMTTNCPKLYTFETFSRAQIEALLKNSNVTGVKISHQLNKSDTLGFTECIISNVFPKGDTTKISTAEAIRRCPVVCE